MKFSCEQNTLVKALNTVSKAVTSRTTIPILKGILLKIDEEGILTISASDLEIAIEKSFKVDNFEAGSTVVQAKLFGDIIRKLPSGIITLEENNNNVLIKCSNSEFNIVGSPADEFPKLMNNNETSQKISFDKDLLKEMINKTSFSASIDESRGVITGVLIEMKEKACNMVALDGFRMAVAREAMVNKEEKNIIIPAKTLNEVSKIISELDFEGNVDFYMNNKKATFIIDDTKVELSLLDGNFVDYNNILPKESKIKIVVNRNDLLESIERASLLAKVGKNNLVKLDIKGNNIEITSKSEEGNVKENVLVTKEGDDLVIGFNSKYLIDAIKVINDDEIKLLLNTPVSPCLIKPLSGDSYEYLVLPVRITN